VSLRRISAIASLTLTELTRQKVFYVLLLFALLLIGSSTFLARFTFQQEFQVLKDISLGAMSIFLSLLAIVATARLLPQEIEDRTVYTILAKPVPRWEYVIGKLAGVLVLLLISAVVMSALFAAVLYLRQQAAITTTTAQMAALPPEQLEEALRSIRESVFSRNLAAAVAVTILKACLLAALTLFISSFATSSIFTIVVTVFVYFIGHLQATAREFWLQEQGAGWLSRTFLAAVALLFPDLQQFNFADAVVAGATVPLTLFLQTLGLGCFYIVFYLLLAAAIFSGREL
jgi:ABC-2 type transport system permease protein